MGIYVYTFMAIFILAGVEILFSYKIINSAKSSKLKFPLVYITVFIFLYYMLSLRKFTGTDTYVYYRIFNFSSLQLNVEEGFRWLIQLTQNFGGDFFEFEKVIAVITLLPILLTIYHYSPLPLYSSLIFFSTGSYFGLFNTMRQGIALALTFFAISFFCFSTKKMYFKLVITIPVLFGAMLFHLSSLLIVIVLFCIFLLEKCFEKSKNTIWFLYSVIFITFVTKVDLLQLIFHLSTISPIGDFSSKYLALYGGSNYLSNNSSSVLLVNFVLILVLFIINTTRIGKSNMAVKLASILGIYLILLSTRNGAQLYTRIIYYLDILLVLIFPLIFKESIKFKKYVVLTICIEIIYILFNFFRMIYLNFNGIIPYGIQY